MDNFMQLANIQCSLFFNHKQHNLFEFGNAEYTNLNASMFQNLRFPLTANVETPKQTAHSLSTQLTKTQASCYRSSTSDCSVTKEKTQYYSQVSDDRVGRTGQDWSTTSSIQLQFKLK